MVVLGLLCLATATAAAGCGGSNDAGDQSSNRIPAGSPGQIGIDASSREDRKIGVDLRTYVLRLGGTPAQREEFDRYCADPPDERREAICEEALQAFAAVRAITTIEVRDGVITLHAEIPDDESAHAKAVSLCDDIQAADVADFTPGHKVVDGDGSVILTCPTRVAP
jgi:hypothetical protein